MTDPTNASVLQELSDSWKGALASKDVSPEDDRATSEPEDEPAEPADSVPETPESAGHPDDVDETPLPEGEHVEQDSTTPRATRTRTKAK